MYEVGAADLHGGDKPPRYVWSVAPLRFFLRYVSRFAPLSNVGAGLVPALPSFPVPPVSVPPCLRGFLSVQSLDKP